MTASAIIARVLFTYLVALALVRFAGKRTIYEGSPLDFVVAVVAGDLFDGALWGEVAPSQFATAMGTLFGLHLIVTFFTQRSALAVKIVQGSQRPLIEGGNFRWDQMETARLSHAELMEMLRARGVEDVREVSAADIERSGRVSVLRENWARQPKREDRQRILAGSRRSDE